MNRRCLEAWREKGTRPAPAPLDEYQAQVELDTRAGCAAEARRQVARSHPERRDLQATVRALPRPMCSIRLAIKNEIRFTFS